MGEGGMTLARYLTEHRLRHPGQGGDLSGLLAGVATAVKTISVLAGQGALAGALGSAEVENVQGEVQKRLDVFSNEVMVGETEWTGYLSAMVSEEMAGIHPIPDVRRRGDHLLLFDPLDGSSNIDINLSVGTIFSVLRSPGTPGGPRLEDFLQAGTGQVCAGFALYGPSTMLVLTLGEGVDAFTLDRERGEFVLTHPGLSIPADCREFAINTSNERFWEPPVQRYVRECVAGRSGPRQADFNMRWVASLVADAWRILTRGGIFLYPKDTRQPTRPGRLRLLYECNPIAFVVEQAGGAATTGRDRILGLEPEDLHQRVPFVFGSANEVARVGEYHRAHPVPGA